ncbi:SDR family oxidoreductase [Clavibacter capsici]|uniref:SDR family oxidoreductase n=1 Tax=Clavibacter capsici TaxID=1874630 RepID=UPI00287BB298|nr:SDR family oxidoreductase [Clavibacter capsici]
MKTWFITGASKGFGREWAEAALERGDRVAATARDTSTLDAVVERHGDAVLPIELDVTDRDAGIAAVQQAAERFGSLDIVVNNAGFGQFGAIEEITEDEARGQFETNLFGALWITQAAVEIMREQRSGHVVQVSSIGGISAFTNTGIYHASKWALEGLSQSLALEVAEFGIHVTLVEPAGYSTDWSGASAKRSDENPAYDGMRERRAEGYKKTTPGDPTATRDAILAIVDAEEPPLRIFLGDGPLAIAEKDYAQRLETWREWEPVSVAAHGKKG